MILVDGVGVRVGLWAFALEVLATHQAAINIDVRR